MPAASRLGSVWDRRVEALADLAMELAAELGDATTAADRLREAAARASRGRRDPSGSYLLWSARWRLLGVLDHDGTATWWR